VLKSVSTQSSRVPTNLGIFSRMSSPRRRAGENKGIHRFDMDEPGAKCGETLAKNYENTNEHKQTLTWCQDDNYGL